MHVRMTETMGRGVFVSRPIAAGEVMDTFHTIRIPPDEVRAMVGGTMSRYWFEDDHDGAAFVVLGILELVNHSLSPNADRAWMTTPEGEIVRLVALRDIGVGEQVFIDYRFDGGTGDPPWAKVSTPVVERP